ncbi:MAG: Rpn family recombination-promoting nuclease/putative transposase [Clostridiales bacterium]|jgi:predicted transposase/invertase (TIGR01784 family)|nr:Rpn family recombination-promoting nuclease/putative transposase [Clostridiales bacterium]
MMTNERLNPLNDYLFMKYMGEKGDEEQLLSFLNAVLQRTDKNGITAVEIIENRMFSAETIGDKASILDIRAVLIDGTKVNIEVQLRNVGNMDKRSLFYWSREYTKGIEAGEDYIKLPNVIAINIVNVEFIALEEVHTSYHLWEDNHKEYMLTDALEIHFIDMVKFRRLREKDIVNNPLHRWLTFFDKNTNENILEEIIQMDTAIQKAQEKIRFVRGSEEEFRAYQMREMALSDFTSGINNAERKGIVIGEQRGITIGKQQERMKYIRKLSQKGLSDVDIADLIDLSIEEVKNILNTP